jgi:hypothetical protein
MNDILVSWFGRNLHAYLTHDAGKEIDKRVFVVVGNAHFRNYRSEAIR